MARRINTYSRGGIGVLVVSLAATITTPAAKAEPADGRHAELISGGLAPGRAAGTMYPYTSKTGETVVFSAQLTQPFSQNGSGRAPFVARRSASGWRLFDASLPGNAGGPATGTQLTQPKLLPPDAPRIISQTYGNQDPANPVSDPANLRDWVFAPGASSGASLFDSPFQNTLGAVLYGQQTLSSFFLTARAPTSGDPGPALAAKDGTPVDFFQIVRKDGTGLSIATRLPDGSLVDADSLMLSARDVTLYGGRVDNAPDATVPKAGSGTNAISVDGRRLFFSAYDAATKQQRPLDTLGLALQPLFESGEDRAVAISTSEIDGTAKAARFIGASPDGDVSYFVANESLEGDSGDGAAVYRFQLSAPGSKLTRLTPRVSGATIDDLKIRSAQTSRDGSTVYFVTAADLGGGAQAGSQNAYVWGSDGLRFIADLGGGFAADGTIGSVSQNGRYAVLRSSAPVGGAPTGGFVQLFRYAYSAPAGERLICVSCRADGSANEGSSGLRPPEIAGQNEPPTPDASNPRGISDDGRVFFTAADRLVAADTTLARDVYEYTGTALRMLSDGRGTSYVVDNSDDGDSVFIITAEAATADDSDGGEQDLYVRRTGRDIERTTPPTPCAGDACQGVSRPQSPGPAATSSRGGSSGNIGRLPRVPGLLLGDPSLFGADRLALARGQRASVRIRLRGAGRLTLRATSRITGKRRTVAAASVAGRKSSSRTVSVRLRLNALGLRQLRRAGSLRVRIEARYGTERTRTTTVTLRRTAR